MIWNRGKNVLTGVEIAVHNNREYQANRMSGQEHRLYVGTIPHEWPKFLPSIVPQVEVDGIADYIAEIWTQNGYYTEVINFRKAANNRSHWAYQYWETIADLQIL